MFNQKVVILNTDYNLMSLEGTGTRTPQFHTLHLWKESTIDCVINNREYSQWVLAKFLASVPDVHTSALEMVCKKNVFFYLQLVDMHHLNCFNSKISKLK